jgi:hypothetical protein
MKKFIMSGFVLIASMLFTGCAVTGEAQRVAGAGFYGISSITQAMGDTITNEENAGRHNYDQHKVIAGKNSAVENQVRIEAARRLAAGNTGCGYTAPQYTPPPPPAALPPPPPARPQFMTIYNDYNDPLVVVQSGHEYTIAAGGNQQVEYTDFEYQCRMETNRGPRFVPPQRIPFRPQTTVVRLGICGTP